MLHGTMNLKFSCYNVCSASTFMNRPKVQSCSHPDGICNKTCIYIPLTIKQSNFHLCVCTVPVCLAVPVSVQPAALSVTALSVTKSSVTEPSVSGACALACTFCKTFCKPNTMLCQSCCCCCSFLSAHSLYQQAVFFAAWDLFCCSVNL